MNTKSEQYAALVELVGTVGLDGLLALTAEYIEKEIEMGDASPTSEWAVEMTNIGNELLANGDRLRKAPALLSRKEKEAIASWRCVQCGCYLGIGDAVVPTSNPCVVYCRQHGKEREERIAREAKAERAAAKRAAKAVSR